MVETVVFSPNYWRNALDKGSNNMGVPVGSNLKARILGSRREPCGFRALIASAILLVSAPVDAQHQPPGDAGTTRGNFVRALAPLDEPRGLCLDIPGHRDRVNVHASMGVHSCKWNIWNLDERFDRQALARGDLRMPAYDLCLGDRAAEDGASIHLGNCDGAPLQRWTFADTRLRLAAAPTMCLTVGPEPSALYQPALSETHCRLASATARPSHCEESLRGD